MGLLGRWLRGGRIRSFSMFEIDEERDPLQYECNIRLTTHNAIFFGLSFCSPMNDGFHSDGGERLSSALESIPSLAAMTAWKFLRMTSLHSTPYAWFVCSELRGISGTVHAIEFVLEGCSLLESPRRRLSLIRDRLKYHCTYFPPFFHFT
jgi:hypothetical protein